MNKSEIQEFFNNKIAQSAIYRPYAKEDPSDEFCIVGRKCIVYIFDSDIIDIYYVKHEKGKISEKPAPTAGVNIFMEKMLQYDLIASHTWDGEAMIRTRDKNAVFDNLKWLGIRKTPDLSDEQRRVIAERFTTKSIL